MASPRTAAIRRVATGTGATLVLTAAAVGVATPAHADAHYTVQRGDTVGGIASRTGATVAGIAAANALENPSYIRVGQVLTIPSRAAAPATVPAVVPAASYTVVQGDTVGRIATKYGTTVAALAAANGLTNPSFIRIGQVLKLPGSTAAPAPVAAPAAPVAATYQVVTGDTLGRIASKYGTTVAALVTANRLTNPSLIRIGQVLTVPGAAAAPAAASPAAVPTTITTTTSYTVARGDTLIGIAAKYGATVAAIQSANGMKGSTLIRIGQVLSVPVTATATPLVGASFAGRTYPAAVVAAANANRATLLAIGVPTKDQVRALIVTTAKAMGVDPALALAVGYQESGFDQSQVSPANAIGAMQVIPSSGQWAGDLVGRQLNLLDARDNVTAGVVILKALQRNAPDLPTAIAGYYQGATSVQQNGMFADTKQYVANVRALMSRFA
jgi:LysM repeat protein